MALFSTMLQKIGVRLDRHDTAIEQIRAELADTKSVLTDYGARIDKIEASLEDVVASFEQKYKELADRAKGAREQRKKDLKAIRQEIDIFIEIVELSAHGQLDQLRKRRVDKLLKNARTKRTRLDNLLNTKVANDAA